MVCDAVCVLLMIGDAVSASCVSSTEAHAKCFQFASHVHVNVCCANTVRNLPSQMKRQVCLVTSYQVQAHGTAPPISAAYCQAATARTKPFQRVAAHASHHRWPPWCSHAAVPRCNQSVALVVIHGAVAGLPCEHLSSAGQQGC